jgi:hypothetical protein
MDDIAGRILNKCLGKKIAVDKKSKNNKNLIVKKVGNKFMLFDTNIGEFLIGYTFDNEHEAKLFIKS